MDQKKNKYGVVQGRLVSAPSGVLQNFPSEYWELECEIAKANGIAFIEYLSERKFNQANPLWSEVGRANIRAAFKRNELETYSVCSDYIIENEVCGQSSLKTRLHLERFLDAINDVGFKTVILPLLECSSINSDNKKEMIDFLRWFADQSDEIGVSVCVETLLNADELLEILADIGRDNVSAVFDTGNRAAFKEPTNEEISKLGSFISHVHIKDKNGNGQNVLLGTGLVNFYEVFALSRGLTIKVR